MRTDRFKKGMIKYANILEMIIGLTILLAIALGFITIIRYLIIIFQSDVAKTYEVLKKFLGVALLMIIGIELVLMLLSHSTSSILELVLFAIARKMLVYSETMIELLVGTTAIALVFLIRKYLMSSKYALKEGRTVSAASPVHALNFDGDLNIPEDKGITVGGLICNLAEENCVPIEEGAEYEIGNVKMRIIKMKDGLIEQVALKEKNKK